MTHDFVDINVSYGNWPFQSFALNSLEALTDHLKVSGISHAFASHLGSVFDPDTEQFNRMLVQDCSSISNCFPVPTVNPAVPGWREQLEALLEIADIKALKAYPSYHNVNLSSKEMDEVARFASESNLQLMIVVRLEDARTRYHGLGVTGVPTAQMIEFCQTHTSINPVFLNAYLPEIREISSSVSNVYFDTSFAAWFFVMETLRDSVGLSRILFGSHSPFLTTGASLDKVRLARLSELEKTIVLRQNASELFGL
ncbi:MAG: amidohydrolase family protein [Rhodothermales bacterium]|nr:amidohydrolase family protein [Rhodothermales bacterium]